MLTSDLIRTLLPGLLLLPIAAGVALRFLDGQKARMAALSFAIAQLLLTIVIVAGGMFEVQDTAGLEALTNIREKRSGPVFAPRCVPGDPMTNGKQTFTTKFDVMPFSSGHPKIKAAQFFIGIDGLNIWLIGLAGVMLLPVVLLSWDTVTDRLGAYYSWLFLLQAGVTGAFLSFDLLFFYVCFELTLVPLLFLIGGWGPGPNRRDAARKLFLYTLAGGLMTLVGLAGTVLYVYDRTGELTFSIPKLAELIDVNMKRADEAGQASWQNAQMYLFLAMAFGFMVKIPLVPFHSWLPGAYSEAPPGVTVMLSALLAKMGTFGLLRICLPLAPDATLSVGMPLLGFLGAFGIVYGAMCAYMQTDFRRLVAYSSISHLGFCALAIVSFNSFGISGSVLHMVNHGLSTGAMFVLVGMLTRRYASSQIADFSGIWLKLPMLTFFMIFIALATVGLPGLNNFVSEVLMMGGLIDMRNTKVTGIVFAAVAGFGIFLSAWYTLTMIRTAFFGPLKEPQAAVGEVKDLTGRERFAIGPLALLCLLLGVMAQPVLDVMKRDSDRLAQVADDARLRVK
ncbi:complex I subunit 4 family protein [Zavarzinella formosa]|uniref:complex I subunit 4 family protein n=1 Tax=Zavarzinella formosa TaxID=360055 RepID=UPI0002D26C39|nr:NADH-quinone oxidoreductase subunit M [Zavarzinella formosa]